MDLPSQCRLGHRMSHALKLAPVLALFLSLHASALRPSAAIAQSTDSDRSGRNLEAALAIERLKTADAMFCGGNPAGAYEIYNDLIAIYPTWWLAKAKAAVAAKAMHMPAGKVASLLESSDRLSPTGLYLPLIRLLDQLDQPNAAPIVTAVIPPAISDSPLRSRDPLDVKISLARALAFEKSGHPGGALVEYRGLLMRHPGCLVGRWRLAHLLESLDRLEEAMQMLVEGSRTSRLPSRWLVETDRIRRLLEGDAEPVSRVLP